MSDADANWQGIRTPLNSAVRNNRVEIVQLLLAAGADPSLPDKSGKTPLELTGSWNPEIEELLEQAAQDK